MNAIPLTSHEATFLQRFRDNFAKITVHRKRFSIYSGVLSPKSRSLSTIIYYFVKMKEMYVNLGIKVLTSSSVPYWLMESNFVPQQINFLCVGFSPVCSCTAYNKK